MSDVGATWSAYNPAPGTDPTWDSFVAAYTAKAATAQTDATRQKSALDTEYQAGVSALDFQAPGMRRDLEASLLQRGVGRSSQAIRRRGELEGDLLGRRNAADRARLEGYDAIDSALAKDLTGLAAEREAQIAASRLRLLEQHKNVPGVDVPGGTALPGTGTTTSAGGTSASGGGQRSASPAAPAAPKPAKPKASSSQYRDYASQWAPPSAAASKPKAAPNKPMLPRTPSPYKVVRY